MQGLLTVLSDLTIGSFYFVLPVIILYFAFRRVCVPFRSLFITLSLFLFSSGLIEVGQFFNLETNYPSLWIVARGLTALIALVTIVLAVKALPRALEAPNTDELMGKNAVLSQEIEVRKRAQREVLAMNQDLQYHMRTAAEMSRCRSEDFDRFADTLPQLVWAANAQGDMEYHNFRWIEYTGQNLDECCGEKWCDLVHPEDRDSCRIQWRECVRLGKPFDVNYRIRDKNGTYNRFVGQAVPFKRANGEILRWFGSSTMIEDVPASPEVR